MSKTRFAKLVVLVCIGSLAGCTSGEGDSVGNTELNVIVPNGAQNNGLATPDGNNGSTAPGVIDIQGVEYTINCLGTAQTFLDENTALPNDGAVQINGNLEVVDGRTSPTDGIPPEFGTPRPGDGAEIWQGFMDLPPGACTVQLRARDRDGEVICTGQEDFTIVPDTTSKVNLVLVCDVSFQAPVGMLDLDATFSFVVGNFCPDLIVLNCNPQDETVGIVNIAGFGNVAAAGCQVRARDVDSTCGQNCDPQDCTETPQGLTCVPALPPANGLNTTVICTPTPVEAIPGTGIPSAIMDCDINGQPDFVPAALPPVACQTTAQCGAGQICAGAAPPSTPGICAIQACSFDGDVLGTVGQQLPSALNPGEGGYAVAFTLCDATFQGLGLCTNLGEPLAPGATMTCVATTTDGDKDCDKTKSVTLSGPGLSPCAAAGCIPGQDCAFCDDGIECSTDTCNDSTGSAQCEHAPRANTATCFEFAPAGGLCSGTDFTCVIQGCNTDADCPAGNPNECTAQATCNPTSLTCNANPPGNFGGPCNTSGVGSLLGTCGASGSADEGVCVSIDECLDNAGCDPQPANECLANICDKTVTPYVCDNNVPQTDVPCNCDVDGNNCAGVCSSTATCDLPPVVGPGTGNTVWQAIPKICNINGNLIYDPVTTSCTCAPGDVTTISVPGGGKCDAFTGPGKLFETVVKGCEAPGGSLQQQLALDTEVAVAVASTGDGNITTNVVAKAVNVALGSAATLVTLDQADFTSSVTGGTPSTITNSLQASQTGQVLGYYTGGGTVLLLDGSFMAPTVTPVTPSASATTVDVNYNGGLTIVLTIQASGAAILVDGGVCTFDVQGSAVSLPVL